MGGGGGVLHARAWWMDKVDHHLERGRGNKEDHERQCMRRLYMCGMYMCLKRGKQQPRCKEEKREGDKHKATTLDTYTHGLAADFT